MENVVRYLRDPDFHAVDFQRYRRLQIFSVLSASKEGKWTRIRGWDRLWTRLSFLEKLLTIIISLIIRCSKALGVYKKSIYPFLWKWVDPTDFEAITEMCDRGSYARLTQVYSAIEKGIIRR